MSPRRPRGELTAHILRALWDAPAPLSSRDIQATFPADESPALTTVLTVLDRLRSAGEITRHASPAGDYLFSPARSESRFIADSMLDTLLKSRDREDVLLGFAGSLDEADLSILRRALGVDTSSR